MKVREAAAYLRISERKLRQLIAEREVRVAWIGTRIILREVDLDEFVKKCLR